MSDNKRLELHSLSSVDLQYRGSQTPKASPTTSTSANFYNLIDKEKTKKSHFGGKPRKLKDLLLKVDPIIETEEVKLLFKLYLPRKKQLINDNSQALKQLNNNLPLLIPHSNETTNISYPKLNFELHMFLATIVTNYVSSWYLTKLNTDNLEFIQVVYSTLCDFIKDLSRRASILLNSENLLIRIDELSGILNNHLLELIGDTRNVKLIDTFKNITSNNNIITSELSDSEIVHNYLIHKHVIFESEGSRQQFFRVFVKKMLSCSFNEDNLGVLNSQIGTNFVINIVADLVLNNIVNKLSTPDFIFSNLKKIIDIIKCRLDKRQKQPQVKTSIKQRIKNLFSMSYKDLSYLMIWNYNDGMDTNHNIFDNNIFQLINTLTGFSSRKPIFTTIIRTIKGIIGCNDLLSTKFNRIMKKTLFRGLVQSKVIDDEPLSKIIRDLRIAIFNKTSSKDPSNKEIITVDSLTNDIYDVLNHDGLPFSIMDYFKFHGETKEDVLKSIKSILLVFNYVPVSLPPPHDSELHQSLPAQHNNELNECCELNQLLIMQIIDSLTANLYGWFE